MDPADSQTNDKPSISSPPAGVGRRRFIVLGAGIGSTLLAGCSANNLSDSVDGGETGTAGSTTTGGEEKVGTFRLLISDQPVAIGDFDSLEVSFDRARVFRGDGEEADGDDEEEPDTPTETATASPATNTTATGSTTTTKPTDEEDETDEDEQPGFQVIDLDGATVDLTQVVGEKAIRVFEGDLPEGRYTKIELYAVDVGGVVDGKSVEVKIPSGKLQIVKPFEVVAGETLSFVFDINVVKKGQTGEYNLLPVIAKSGVAGEDVEVEEVEDDESGDETETDTVDGEPEDPGGNESDQGQENGPPENETGGP